MALSVDEFLGLLLSGITELWSIELFQYNDNPITLGSVIVASMILPVMFTLLFPSFNR